MGHSGDCRRQGWPVATHQHRRQKPSFPKGGAPQISSSPFRAMLPLQHLPSGTVERVANRTQPTQLHTLLRGSRISTCAELLLNRLSLRYGVPPLPVQATSTSLYLVLTLFFAALSSCASVVTDAAGMLITFHGSAGSVSGAGYGASDDLHVSPCASRCRGHASFDLPHKWACFGKITPDHSKRLGIQIRWILGIFGQFGAFFFFLYDKHIWEYCN